MAAQGKEQDASGKRRASDKVPIGAQVGTMCEFARAADLEIGDTAGLETCATTEASNFVNGRGGSSSASANEV